MIFKTFENNDIDKWTAKIGLFGKSFNDVIDSINKRKLDIDNLMSSGLVSSYSDAKKQVGGLFSYLYSKKDIKSQLIDVDSIFPKIDTSNVDEIKTKIVKMSKSISDGKKTWQELFDALPSGEKYFAELGQQMEGQIITEEGLISANQKARASTIAHNNALKQQTLGAKAASIAMKGLALAGNMLAMYLTTKLLQGLYELSQVSKSVAKNAQEMGEAFNSAKSDLSLYRDKVETLQKTIRDSASSTEEVIEARKSLLSIQDELIEKYGTEKEAIVNISLALDSNTDFIDKNASAWERLTDAQWQVQKNKFNDGGFWNDMGNTLSGYSDNIDRMINEYGNYKVNINVGEISGLDNRKEVENILKEFGDLDYTDAGVAQIELKGNATDVYNQLLKIQKKVNEIEGDYTSNFTKAMTKMANEASDVSDKYKDAYNSYLLQEKIFPNDEYRSILNEINSLADAYNEAFTSGDEDKIKEVSEKYASYISNLNLNDKPVLDFFKGMYPKLQTVVDKWTFETEIIPKFDTSSLNRMNSNDIYAFLNTGGIQEGENIFNELLSSAEEFGLVTGTNSEKVSQFIELLEELGIIQKAMKKEAFDASEHSLSDIFSLKDSSNNLTDLGKISEEIDNIQTAAKGLKEAMDAYNSTGVISIDQLQAILSYGDKYLKYITDENGNLVLNEEAIKNVAHARLEELRAKTLDNLYSNLENITNEKTAQAYLASQTLDTAESYEVLAKAKLDAWKVDALKNRDKNGMSISTINKVYSNMLKQYTAINNLFDNTNLASIFDATTSSANKTETALDRITKKYKELTDVIGSNVNLILSQIKLLEAQGKEVGSAYYTELVDQSSAKIAVLTEQFNELRKEFLNTPKGTDEWLELNAAILEVQNSIIEAKTSMAEYQKTLDNMKWDRAEKTFNALSDTISSNTDLVEAEISKLEASGERVGKVFYAGLIGMVEKNITTLTDRHKTLMEQLTTTEEGSDDWIDLNKSIFDCQKAIIDAQKSLAKYSKTLDGIDWEKYQSIYDASSNVIDNYKETIQAQIDVAEAGGKEVGKAYYEALISASQDDINFNLSRRNELIEQLGTVEEGSEEWSNIRDEIDSVDQAVIKCNVDIAGYQKTLDSIDWERATEKYNTSMDIINANDDLIQSQISQIETAGGTVGKAFYEALISNIETEIGVYSNRLKELQARLLSVDEGSEEWISLNTEILDVQNSILGAKEKIEGFQNSIDSLHWDELDRLEEAINGISNEAGNIVDLLDLDKVLDDNGAFTNDAVTALAMYGEQLETAQYLINKYSKEIEYLNGEYTKGSITTEEYNEKMQDLNDKQWESVDAYNAAKKAIIELRKKGIEEEIDALEDLYDARKKAWEQEKDQHDWEKTVSENETNINKLKAQIAELQNDNSLAGIKKRKELEDELNKAESDWEDTLYDHVYDEHQDQLDKELDDKKKALEKTLDDEEKLVTDSIDLVNQNCSTVLDNLNRLSREYGIQISNSITEGFKGGENALSSYSSKFSEAHSGFTTQLGLTEGKVYDVQKQADSTSKSLLNMFGSTNGTLDEQLDTTTGKIDNAHTEADKAALAFLNMLLTENGTLAEQIDKVKRYVEESYDAADSASLKFWQMLQEKNGTLDAQLDSTKIKIDAMYTSADTASQEIVNMFKSTNGTLGTQLDKVKSTLEAINAEADKAKTALSNIGMNVPAPADSSATGVLGSVTHDNSGTILPDAGTYPNADRDIKNLQTKAEEISKDAAEAARKTDEEKKKKPVLSGGSKTGGSNNKLQISKAYATGTKSAIKGWHPMFEEGVEAIEKDGELLVPLSGGEMVFNNEQLRKLWEFSKDPENMAKLSASIYGNMPKFGGNLTPNIPINNTQNVNVEQHFDALVKVEGDMTPDVYKQLATDKRIDSLLEGKTFKYLANAYNTRGYRL